MGKRRAARESALRVLFELEFNEAGLDAVLARTAREDASPAEVRDYTGWLVRGVTGRRDEIDALIQGTSKHWRVARMGLIDRNILRLAAFELLEERLLAPAIIINEAIEIAKRYSGESSADFVNGVLDAVRKTLEGAPPSEVNDHERPEQPSPKGTARRSGRGTKKRPGPRPRGQISKARRRGD